MAHTAESLQLAFKYLFPAEVPFLKKLAKSLPDNPTVINIGAGAGTSGLAFMESRDDLRLITIDIQLDDSPFGCLAAEEMVLRSAGLWNERVTHEQGDSYTIGLDRFSGFNPLVDMVFVDGDHTYEGCKNDIIAWLPNIKRGGIIAIHDYKKSELFAHEHDYHHNKPHPRSWPGVDKAVDEMLLDRYELIERVESLIAFRV